MLLVAEQVPQRTAEVRRPSIHKSTKNASPWPNDPSQNHCVAKKRSWWLHPNHHWPLSKPHCPPSGDNRVKAPRDVVPFLGNSTFPKVPIHSCTHFQRSESASTLVSSFVHISFFKLMMSSVRFSSFSCICCKVFDTSSIQLSWFFKASWMSPISSLAVGWLKQWFFQRNRINQIFELCNCSTWRTYPPVPHGRDLSSHCGFHTLATGDNGVGSIHTSAHPWREGTEVKNGVTNNLKHLLVTSNFSASILFLGNFLAFWPLNKLCDV